MNKYVTMYNMILVHNSMYSHSHTPFHAAVPSVSRSRSGTFALAFGGVRVDPRAAAHAPSPAFAIGKSRLARSASSSARTRTREPFFSVCWGVSVGARTTTATDGDGDGT